MDGWIQLKHPQTLDNAIGEPVQLIPAPDDAIVTDDDPPDSGVPATI